MIVQKRGPYRTVPLFDLRSRGPKVDLLFEVCNVNGEPYFAVNSLALCFKTPVAELRKILDGYHIKCVKVRHGISYRDFMCLESLIEAFEVISTPNAKVAFVERMYMEAKSSAFRRRVFKALDLPFDNQCVTPMKTTAGEYMCCGAYSFKPIAKASFE